jgi:hypothetical protein
VTDEGRGRHNCFILIQSWPPHNHRWLTKGEGDIIVSSWFKVDSLTIISSPHDEHMFSGPRPVNFVGTSKFLFRTTMYIKINSRMWLGPVNSNFHFKDCIDHLSWGRGTGLLMLISKFCLHNHSLYILVFIYKKRLKAAHIFGKIIKNCIHCI